MANWGAIVGGVLAAGSTIYAANQQKKMQQEQYKQQQNLYNEQMQYQQNQINSARNTPIAQLAPIFMEQLINAYSGKLSKYGINFPVDEMMRIIGRGGGQPGGQSGGSGGGMQATMMPLVDPGGSRGYHKAKQTDFQDQHSEESRRQMMAVGGGTGRLLRHAVDTSGGAYADAIWNQETGNVLRSMGYGGSPQFEGGNDKILPYLMQRYDAAPNSAQTVGGILADLLPGSQLVKGAAFGTDRGWFDNYLYGNQMIQPIKDGNPAWYNLWNHGNIMGSSMDFEGLAGGGGVNWDNPQTYGDFNSWGR